MNENTFAIKLTEARTNSATSVATAAAVVGVDRRTYRRWEKGTRTPIKYHHDKLVRLFPSIRDVAVTTRDMLKPGYTSRGDVTINSNGFTF